MIPDLTPYGYQIITELGSNREGGRITWKGKLLDSDRIVVIKQFCFASTDASWSGYKAYQREIEILQSLNHRGIPKYLASLETDNGFCLIQEYIDAISLAKSEKITLEQIWSITIKILDILVYLQEQDDSIFHRDLKPENILVDRELNPYLIDFGLAKIGAQENNVSSIIQGTPGFMAPEQAIAPTKASDLYSLGVTIICLLTNKKSADILSLTSAENPYQLEFKSLLKQLDPEFLAWLNKMVNPQVKHRFPDAATALNSLKELTWDGENLGQENHELAIASATMTSSSISDRLLRLGSMIPISPFYLGTIVLGILGAAIIVGIDICDRVTEPNLFNLVIAAIGIMIVCISQSAAVVSFNADRAASKEALVFAIVFPLILVSIAGISLGWGEAVAMTVSVLIAQALNLGYLLLQTISFQFKNHKLSTISLLLAVFLGLLFGNIITP